MSIKPFIILVFAAISLAGCKPDRDNDVQLPPTPEPPQFSVAFVTGDPNRVVLTDLSTDNFQRLWSLPGGTPKTSAKAVDTIFYDKAGEYAITLQVSKTDGSGSPSSTQKVVITVDAVPNCDPKMALLTGDCGTDGKCWTFSHEAGAVKVGPTYDDYSWFTSPVNGLQAEQYDDGFCFTFDNQVFVNNNNGLSVDPWAGYTPVPHAPGVSEFSFLAGTGIGGRDQIVLPDDQFMGVWDADNVLDIVKLTADELVVRARQREQNGTPKPEGWFELHFVRQ